MFFFENPESVALDLSNREFKLQSANALVTPLRYHEHLETLDLSNSNLTGLALEVLSGSLEKNRCLRSLDISGNPMDYEDAKLLSRAIHVNFSIRRFFMNDCEAGDDSMQLIFGAAMSHKPAFREFQVAGNKLSTAGAQVFAFAVLREDDPESKPFPLESIMLARNRIGNEGMRKVKEVLAACSNVTSIDMSSNRITDAGVEMLAELVEESSSIRHVFFGRNPITSLGLSRLMTMMQVNQSLMSCDLGDHTVSRDNLQLLRLLHDSGITMGIEKIE
eukprot:TRINITY_DN12205_c0_g2_i1.p1 TRINITY_DN12205_c0_g2~~TRINITY_DN12205_c0_g2_i1.p1  ORF type:complete len:315 (+),score=103.70 TRINITY_DN12205_c0_g2_i1:118-945(+)